MLLSNRYVPLAVGTILLLTVLGRSSAQDPADDPYAKRIAGPSDDAVKAIKRIRVAENLKVDLWAAEPLLANPVAFCFDEKGRMFLAETYRLNKGTPDNRGHMSWLEDELAARSVADRLAMYRKYLGKNYPTYEIEQDRVRLIEDTKGTGKADKSTIFAGGFKDAASGLGSGVIARGGKVWYTCIPDLWLLQDTKGTGRADVKKSLHTGYGVHVSFIGHDSHGLRFGPDGRLYFSVGDRGLFVETEGRTLAMQDTGSVLRCNPDGSELEIFATGLRNPQELAFDQYGNLFTGDNNADGGDAARWVYLVQGGDSGWRIGYQYTPGLGPWNAEKLWHKAETNTASYLLPPLDHLGNGPSGLTYFPGAALLPARYLNHFFLCDFRGSAGGSGIWSFAMKPKGASFEMSDRHQFVWSVLATDCEFGPDGCFYVSDWVDGWGMPFKGRIYKFHDTTGDRSPAAEVKKLLADGFSQRPEEELAKLLGHTDLRIRQEAQFALADRTGGERPARQFSKAKQVFIRVSHGNEPLLSKLHAIWGLGQIARQENQPALSLLRLLHDREDEVRAQAAKTLGDMRVVFAPEKGSTVDKDWTEVAEKLVPLLGDASPRVRFFAAQSLGKIGRGKVHEPIVKMLLENADKDHYLRHAGVLAMAGNFDHAALEKAATHPSSSIRLAALLAMRRTKDAGIRAFLQDVEPRLVLEAARAIADTSLAQAYPDLAAILDRPLSTMKDWPTWVTDPLFLRAEVTAFRLATKENAQALARFAGRGDVSDKLRVEALKYLSDWANPSGRDRFDNLWRPVAPRPAEAVAEVLRPALAGIMTGSDQVRGEGVKLAAKYGIKEIGPVLHALVADKSRSAAVRVETLLALEKLKDAKLFELAENALQDEEPRIRHQARRLLLKKQEPAKAVAMLSEVLDKGAVVERQGALALLADLKTNEADAVLSRWLDLLLEKKTSPEIQLDILEAGGRRGTAEMQARLKKLDSARSTTDHLAKYRETMFGGDAEAGKKLFFERKELSCLRCHKVQGIGGTVGPDLTGIGKKQKRDYLLESIVDPNRQIAKGYDTVVLTLNNGQVKSGILRHEDKKEVHLMTAEGQTIVVPTAQIEERSRGKSAMPEDLIKQMSRSELRDLVEYLAGL
jgi:quinoprotein glucose dehydrogenase